MSGFFARWRRRTSASEGPHRLALASVLSFVDKLEGERFARVVDPANRLRAEIEDAVAGLHALAENWVSIEVKEATYGAPRATVQSSRDTLVRKFRSLSENFQAPALQRFADLATLKTTAEQLLAQAGEAAGTHSRYLVVQFAPQVRDLKVKLRQLQETVLALDRLIGEHRAAFTACTGLRSEATHIERLFRDGASVADRLASARQRVKELEMQQDTLRGQLAQLMDSPAYAAHLAQRQRAEAVHGQLRAVQGRFESEFALLTKPLRKFGYVVGLDKADRQLLDRYVEAPWNTFTAEQGQRLSDLLGQLAQAVGSGRVDVKEPAKTRQRSERLVAALPGYLAEQAQLAAHLQQIEAESAGAVSAQVQATQRTAEETTRHLEEGHREIERLVSEQAQLTQELSAAKRGFEGGVQEAFAQEVQLENSAEPSESPVAE